MKSGRLFEIVYRLLEGGQCTAPALAKELEVSVRTIYRDIDALCQAGVPIATAQGNNGGIRLMEGWTLNKTLMSTREQEQLLTAVQSLAGLQQGSDTLAVKLGALFQKQPRDWLRVDFHRWGPVNENDERFEIIKTAVQEKRVLQFSYAGYEGFTQRRVKPLLLYFKGDAWYLQAFCLIRGDFRTFKISRVSGLVLTNELFDDTPAPPPIDPWEWNFQWPEVRLRFQPQMAYRVYDDFDEECIRREADGSLIVTTHMPVNDEWSAGRLLSYGTGAEVLSPDSLRKTVAACALRLCHHYGKENETRRALSCLKGYPVVTPQQKQQEETKMEIKLCQSCAMLMTVPEARYGTEKDGTPNPDYCSYCYDKGEFLGNPTMEQMIRICLPYELEAQPDKTEEEVLAQMQQFFPTLKRWR